LSLLSFARTYGQHLLSSASNGRNPKEGSKPEWVNANIEIDLARFPHAPGG